MKQTWCTFHSIYWESRASTWFEHYLLNLRRRWTIMAQPTDIRTQYTKCRLLASPEDEQVMLETCRGPWFSVNWMKIASRWFHYTDIQQSFSWEANRSCVCKAINRILLGGGGRELYVLHLIQKSPPTTSAYIEPMSVVYTFPSYHLIFMFTLYAHWHLGLSCNPFPLGLSTKTLYIFIFYSIRAICYPHSLNHSNDTGI
jgi:hypothetical protein